MEVSPRLSRARLHRDSRARRTASGPATTPTSRAASTCRSIRSTPPTSTSSKSRGASRPTTSARAPSTSSKARRSWSRASSTRPAGTRRAVVALDAKTGELKWVYSLDEGKRARAGAPRQLSGRGLSYWTDGKGDDRIIYVTTGYRLVALNAKTGQPIATFGKNGIVDLKVGVVIGKERKQQVQIPREGRNRPALDADSSSTTRSSCVVDGRRPALRLQHERQGPRARVRRARPASSSGASTRFPAPASSATTPGRTARGSGPATPACGRRSRSIRRPASSTCRSKRRRSTTTAATARATTCSPRASSRST